MSGSLLWKKSLVQPMNRNSNKEGREKDEDIK